MIDKDTEVVVTVAEIIETLQEEYEGDEVVVSAYFKVKREKSTSEVAFGKARSKVC